jgi:hypothetical protein
MDLSDGFADAVRQLARASGTGASVIAKPSRWTRRPGPGGQTPERTRSRRL